jgi:Cu/Zn superoxide dismutase
MHRMIRPLVLILALLVVHGTSYGQAANFTARFTGQQEVPAVVTPAQGSAFVSLTNAGARFFVTVEGLSGPITAAHFHRALPGTNGGVVRTITPEFAGTNSADGLWTAADPEPLSGALISDLLDGRLYLNVHTAANPGGEIRGQVQLSGGVHFTANLQGTQENPPLAVAASGAASLTLTELGLHYKVTIIGLTGAMTAAHIHTAAIGINGPVTFNIMPTFTGNTATGFITLTPAQRKDLMVGNMYVNVHTAANPGGEIRGQINLAGGLGFSAQLNAGNEVPPNASPGRASASATLTPSGMLIDVTANGLTGPITAAHVHRAPPGVNGPVVRTITGDFISATSATTLWRADDPEALSPGLITELINGNLYLNLHTVANPGGEVRSPLTLNTPGPTATATYTANLTGTQEEPPLAVGGLGTGTFRLTPAGITFAVTVDGLTGPITAAHFHQAGIGVNGGVVRTMQPAEFVGSNTFVGTWAPGDPEALTPARITELFKGNLYFNVHTAANPGGEIRGQILPASGAEFEARAAGTQENPPLAVAGTGTGSFTLTPHGLAFNITVEGLTGAITAAHFHRGPRGVNGAVVRTFAAGEFINPTTLAGVWKPTDVEPLTPALITDLLRGNLYVNFHTAANPGGEIRGQVTLSGGDSRGALMLGSNEVGPVATPGKGTAAMTFTDQGLVFRLSGNDLTGPFTAAHFHNAPPGVNGPVVRDISAEFTNLTADGVWKPSDAMPLTTALIDELMRGNLYLNLHTTTNPGGEIRGQTQVASVVAVGPVAFGEGGLQLAASPNPLKGSSLASFYLPRAGAVNLVLYDVSGAVARRVLSGAREAGWHRVPIEARGLPSGVYFLALQTEGFRMARKLLVLR